MVWKRVAQRCAEGVFRRVWGGRQSLRAGCAPELDRPALIETLEQRLLLANLPMISEFLASNDKGLLDQDRDYSDWIEIYNPGLSTIDLGGFYLTDDSSDLQKWRFPSTELPAGGYLITFASGKDRAQSGAQLHTNFQLDAQGEYLALVAPDGITVVSEYQPTFPQQLTDVSYGLALDTAITNLLPEGIPVRAYVPTDSSLGMDWTRVDFDDSAWIGGSSGVGYDAGSSVPQIPGFTIHMVDVIGGIGDIVTARNIADGPLPGGYTLESDITTDYLVVNHGVGGDFADDQLLPTGQSDGEEYVLCASANIFIPAGVWTFDVGSDDGFLLKIPGVEFYGRTNEDPGTLSDVPLDTLVFSSPRGHGHTSGTILVPEGGLSTTLTLYFYENGGGDDVELSIASGEQAFNENFVLLSDDVMPGWSVTTASSTPPPSYSDLIGTNVQPQMYGHNASAYIRVPLAEVLNPQDFDSLRLRIKYDDGFVAYLNGREIIRRYAPDSLDWQSAASGSRPDTEALIFEEIDIPLPEGLLQAGANTNILAIQGLNEAAGEEDFLIYPELLGLRSLATAQRYFSKPTPGKSNTSSNLTEIVDDTRFSENRGFYDAPFYVSITCDTPGAEIRYTINGATPTATSGLVYQEPILISSTTTIRAAAFKPGAIASNVDTQTYIFTSDVITQSANGRAPAGWPTSWSPNTTDYGMDPDVVNSPQYRDEIEDALKSIPTFSIVTDFKNLFGTTGIYSHPDGDGMSWERPASLELIYPDGTVGFQTDIGLRLRGGFSRSTDNPKHAFRVFLRDKYGDGRLDYPLFGEDAQQRIDSFDLRCAQNYSWSFQGDSTGVFVRDQISRDLQLAMGQPGERGNFYHLYINGQYWGLYNTDERPEASYAANYFGGSPEEYDVIKPAPDNGYNIYATDGNLTAWTNLWNQLRGNISTLANYMRVQGKNPDGTRNPAYEELLDVDNLIDYMLVIYYGGNLDAPLSNFLGNTSPNNFFAVRSRNGTSGGFKYFVHDAEHTLLNLWQDRTGPWGGVTTVTKSNPQTMFELLCKNPEFRLRVADRIHKWFFNDGVLTPASVTAMFTQRRDEIYSAVVAESARWGDAKRPSSPLTRDNAWIYEINRILNDYIPYRTQIVFDQLAADSLYTSIPAPEFNKHGGEITDSFNLTISKPGGQGTIYYTLDGSDPRLLGGGISPSALVYSRAFALSGNATVKARVLYGDQWSALTEADFYYSLASLRVTELMYNPAPPPEGSPYIDQDFEFIELQNTGDTTISLSGVQFVEGILFEFPTGASLAPGQRTVLVRNAEAFLSRYPDVSIGGVYDEGLAGTGERLRLVGPGGTILDFSYNDWYTLADGEGYSLVVIDPAASEDSFSRKGNWRPSNPMHGTPGAADTGYNPESIVISEVMSNPASGDDWIELHNTTSSPIDISGWFLSNAADNLTRYQIPALPPVSANGYVVLDESQFGFDISQLGDHIYLSSNDGPAGLGGYREHVDFGGAAQEVTFGRHVKSTGGTDIVAMSAPTRRAANALPLVGPVVISEIMYNPVLGGHEFIELVNLTGSTVALYDSAHPENTWKFTEGVDYTFPDGAALAPFSYALVVGIEPDLFRSTYNVPANVPIFGPYANLLENKGENLKLARPGTPLGDGTVPYITVDQVHYDNNAPWATSPDGGGPSLSRISPSSYGNDAGNWVAGPSGGTPGRLFVPPAAPWGLGGVAVSGSRIHLAWTDNAVNEDGFHLERSQDGVHFTRIATLPANTTSYDDSSLAPSTVYTYRIQAYNTVGVSPYSNVVNVSSYHANEVEIIGITDTWRYNQARTNLGTSWIGKSYNDSGPDWNSGAALFYWEDSPLPAPKNTLLDRGPSGDRTLTFYFRKHFYLDVDPSAVSSLRLQMVVDDGAVVYLNGNPVPVFTLGMGDGPYSYYTLANRTVGEATYEGSFELPVSSLVKGDNVIAVEVHQTNADSSDIVFGATLSASVTVPSLQADIVDVSPDPSPTPINSINITFSEPVNGFDLSDLRLTRGGVNLLTSAQTLTTQDRITWTLGNLAPLTLQAGDYMLTLPASGSGIVGTTPDRRLGTDAVETFQIAPSAVKGTAGDDTFYLRINGANLEVYASIPPGASPAYTIPLSAISTLNIELGMGNDTLEVADALPFALNLDGDGGIDRLILNAGTHSFNANLPLATGIESLLVKGNASVTLEASQNLSHLQIGENGRVTLAANGQRVLRTGNLEISDNGVLDLADNDLILTHADSDHGAAKTAGLIDLVLRSLANNWDGTGITSSTAKLSEVPTTLAVFNNDYFHDGQAIFSDFGGVAVDQSCILVKYTYFGDLNLDGEVTGDDYALIDMAYQMGTEHPGWLEGDVTYDGAITGDDYALMDVAWQSQSSKLSAVVDEPLVASTVVAAFARRTGITSFLAPDLAILA